MQDKTARGCTGDFSKKKIFSNTFFSHGQLVDMVCHMKSHQGRFQKKSFSCVLYAFSRVFSCFAGKNAFLDGFLVVFTVVRPLVCLKRGAAGARTKARTRATS